jgi:hypothetical protein
MKISKQILFSMLCLMMSNALQSLPTARVQANGDRIYAGERYTPKQWSAKWKGATVRPKEIMLSMTEPIRERAAYDLKTLTDRLTPYKPSQKEEIIAAFCDELRKSILSLEARVYANQNDIESITKALGY